MSTAGTEQPQLSCADIVRLAQTCASLPPYILSPDSHPVLLSNLASLSSSSSVSEYVQSLLSLIALSPQTPSLSSLLASLLLSYIDLFASDRIAHDSSSLKTLELFATLLDHVDADVVPRVVDSIMEYFPRISDSDDAQIVDLVPRCLNLARNSAGFDGGEFVERILDCAWSKGLLVKMVSIAGEFPFLNKVRVREFVGKVFNGMSTVDLQDLPSLVYQLLVLASKGLGKKEVVEGLAVFFGSKMERKSSSMARQVEGTVLLHVNFAVKQDPSLGQEVIGLVRSGLRAFNHFTIAILLSVARVRRFRESSIETLKTSLVSAYRDYKFAKDCKWLSDDLKAEHLQNVQVVEKAMLRSVSESNYGREHIVPSIVQFAFALLESVEEANSKEVFDIDGVLGLEGLAFQMVKMLFEGQDMARNEIIEQCKFRILSLKPDQSMVIIRLLGNLVHAYPYAIQEHVPRLKELLDYFTFMDGKVASGMVTSLLPLTKFSRDLQDYAILVLRKAMFRQEEAVRLAATDAIINLILEEKKSKKDGPFSFQDSSSQAGSSQQVERACSVRSLFHELSGLLQRCLYQQAKVKEALYKGLMKLVLVDPSAGSAVLDLLLPHFLQFYREKDGNIELGSCVKSENGKAYIEEPLDCLLHCVSWIMLLQHHNITDGVLDSSWACFGFSLTQENEAGRNLSFETFSNALQKIRRSLRNRKLAGILGQAQQSQDGGSASLDSDKRKHCALVLYGTIEVVLNAIASELEKATDINKPNLEKEIVEFVELHGSLEKDANLARPGTGTRRGNTHENLEPSHSKVTTQGQNSYLSTSSIFQIMQMIPKLYDSESSDSIGTSQNHNQQSPTKKSKVFVTISFVLGVCLRHLRLYTVLGQSDPVRTLIYGDIKILGPALMRLINFLKIREKHETGQTKREARSKKEGEEQREYLHLALICLKELIQNCLKTSDPTALLEGMLSVIALPVFVPDDEYEKAFRINDQATRRKEMFILKTLKPLFFELLELSSPNEVEVICSIILIAGENLPSDLKSSHGAWSIRVCKEKKITNSKIAKSVATLAISLSSSPHDLIISQAIAKELLQVMGSEKHDAVAVSEVYPFLNHSTRNAICTCLLHLIEKSILDMDWAVKKLKTLCSTTHKSTQSHPDGEHVSGQVFEENLYSRVESVAKVLASFALMCLKESQAESFIRLVTRFYKHLAQISKLRIAPKGFKQVLPSLRFQKLVEITCRQLTSPLYGFVANMQNRQQENSSGKGTMSKIKRENKCIPDLIFQIEDYEKFLIQLSKATKVNLLRYAKRSTARDFKISDQSSVPTVQGNDSVLSPASSCGVMDAEDSEPDEGDDLPNGKRMRIDRVVRDSDEEA